VRQLELCMAKESKYGNMGKEFFMSRTIDMATMGRLKLQLTRLYTVTVNVKKVVIKIQCKDKCFVALYFGGQTSIPWKLRLYMFSSLLRYTDGRKLLYRHSKFTSDG
jgi:hypothetical protein